MSRTRIVVASGVSDKSLDTSWSGQPACRRPPLPGPVLALVAVLASVSALGLSTSLQAQPTLDELRALAEQGDPVAQVNLAALYGSGEGVPQDWGEAVRWLRRAADQGHAPGQSALGLLYREGLGVLRNDAAAAQWFRRAADQGDASGQFLLAAFYAAGRGVVQDDVAASMWLHLAVARAVGEARARYVAASAALAARMTPDQLAEAQRRAEEWTPTPER